GDSSFTPAIVDRAIADGETLELGGVALMARLTPGHTKGCTTWTMKTSSGARTYHVVFYCSTTVAGNRLVRNPEYPDIASDYEKTFATLRRLPCDVFLAPHGSFFHRDEKIVALHRGQKDAFVDSGELKRYIAQSEASFRQELTEQRVKGQ